MEIARKGRSTYERRALGVASHRPFDQCRWFLPEHPVVSLLDALVHHANFVVTNGDSGRVRLARARGGTTPVVAGRMADVTCARQRPWRW